MGFVCNLAISFAAAVGSPTTKETYNINESVAKPDQVCRGAALTTAAMSSIGIKVAFELTKDGITVEGRNGSSERIADKPANPNNPADKGLIQIRQTLNDGSYMDRSFSSGDKPTDPIPRMRQQMMNDTTRSGP